MNRLMELRNRQLQRIAQTIFNTFYAWPAVLHRPETDFEGSCLLVDEQDFAEEDEDVAGSLRQEETPLIYGPAEAAKIAPCKRKEEGKFTLARHGEINEFDPDRKNYFLIQAATVPRQSVLQFELPVNFQADDNARTVSLIKIDESAAGQLPAPGIIHVFSAFHGNLGI